MFMRIARSEDIKLVYELANDPIVRQVSFSPNFIPYGDHVSWFERKIKDSNCLFYLIFDGQNLAGQIRFEKNCHASAEISISISSSYRGKGFAKDYLSKALSSAFKKWKSSEIKALVKVDNIASNKFFIKCGFVFEKQINNKGYECNVYTYRFKEN